MKKKCSYDPALIKKLTNPGLELGQLETQIGQLGDQVGQPRVQRNQLGLHRVHLKHKGANLGLKITLQAQLGGLWATWWQERSKNQGSNESTWVLDGPT